MSLEGDVAAITGTRVLRIERIQSLWGGYGELVRAHLDGGAHSVIVKAAHPPARSREDDASHARKRRSYEVELAFYRTFAPRCDARCRVAKLVGHRTTRDGWIIVLEDLDAAGFADRHHDPEGRQLDACLAWLAAFHARFIGTAPDGLWKIGTYWHLDTRQAELAAMRDGDLRARAPDIDRKLRAARFQTIVHGDAKPDNFCFSNDGVAAVDFQYVGGGCGMKDVAYLLHGAARAIEDHALVTYFALLRAALPSTIDGAALEREWRELHPLAHEDFERFLAGWRR